MIYVTSLFDMPSYARSLRPEYLVSTRSSSPRRRLK